MSAALDYQNYWSNPRVRNYSVGTWPKAPRAVTATPGQSRPVIGIVP